MKTQSGSTSGTSLRILPAYTGAATIAEALEHPRGANLLWLEILVNDQLNLTSWQEREEVREAYVKACRWYHNYRTLIDSLLGRSPLPYEPGPVDPRDYRVFAEVLRFVADHD